MKLIVSHYLVAPQSPKKAFYNLHLVQCNENDFKVTKESGTEQKMLDRREWNFDNANQALSFFRARLREKLNPQRKSPRKYIMVL